VDEAQIVENVRRVLDALPPGVMLLAAAKGRSVEQVRAAVRAGIRHVGHNYVQEAQLMVPQLQSGVTWHMIGHLQRNKVKMAVELFDLVESVDSMKLAREIDKRCASAKRLMPVLIEVNSGREPNKSGVLPEKVEQFVRDVSRLERLQVQGLMTMGPECEDPEQLRPYFRLTRGLLEQLGRMELPGVEMRYLSMGMTSSYQVALEEGANVVRLGTLLFGSRQ
jgi:pyridoxal phosphate enzyme (YggS family)